MIGEESLSRRLMRDQQGATLVEFALVAPVLLTLLLGIFDMGYTIYTDALLQGAIQKAARDSTIEGADGNEAAIDAAVSRSVHRVAAKATLSFQRRAYASFSEVAKPEDFTDTNSDGQCNDGEPFEDSNANGQWDSDRGSVGFGSARDAVLYTVTVTYPRAFPVAGVIGLPDSQTLEASTVLRNQPYGQQQTSEVVKNCA